MMQVSKAYQDLNIGLAFSGGGSRAAAFHLGCMRALRDHGILEHVNILSTVSGGSIIGAMWAYSEGSFEAFDERIQSILRRGLKRGIIRYTLFSMETPKIVATILISGVVEVMCMLARSTISILGVFGLNSVYLRNLRIALQSPLPRFASRTTAFERFLDKEIFKGAMLADVKRKDMQVVINAAELRTESAFRFGSLESGCWRFGKLVDDTPVAKAVAASAAYPVLLPALDEQRRYTKRGETALHRTIVTDGGVYDNVGTSCLIPKRDKNISTNVNDIDFIIACVAGQGLPDGSRRPYFWPSRMIAAISTIHRRTHTMTFDLLHRLRASGEIKGFILPYLGQNDSALPCPPADLVPRDATFDYPTDFDAMPQKDLDLIARRGEQLTHNLLETYAPVF